MSQALKRSANAGALVPIGENGQQRRALEAHQLVYIAGAMERVGTNYLGRLLLAHPAVCRPRGHWELPLLDVSDGFAEFHARFLRKRSPGRLAYTFDEFARCLGDGLMRLLDSRVISQSDATRYLLHKNPSTVGLDRFRSFFPDAKLIILVRDGRDNVNSLLRAAGFHTSGRLSPRRLVALSQYARKWARSARRIRAYVDLSDDHVLVRYEDLHADTERVVREVAAYLGLDVTDEWMEAVRSMPVTGSGFYAASGGAPRNGKIGWDAVAKTRAFQPVGRWRQSWSPLDRLLFRRLAGAEAEALGYSE